MIALILGFVSPDRVYVTQVLQGTIVVKTNAPDSVQVCSNKCTSISGASVKAFI